MQHVYTVGEQQIGINLHLLQGPFYKCAAGYNYGGLMLVYWT